MSAKAGRKSREDMGRGQSATVTIPVSVDIRYRTIFPYRDSQEEIVAQVRVKIMQGRGAEAPKQEVQMVPTNYA